MIGKVLLVLLSLNEMNHKLFQYLMEADVSEEEIEELYFDLKFIFENSFDKLINEAQERGSTYIAVEDKNNLMNQKDTMQNQRLRNLTTLILHTKMDDIYKDIEFITGETGIMTHQLPAAMKAITPWLKEKVQDQRFWDDQFDVTHVGEYDLQPMTKDEVQKMFKLFIERGSNEHN